MTDTIYLNEKLEVVPKEKATRYERYEYDKRRRIVLRIYGTLINSSASRLSQVSGSVKVSEK